jgi:DNA-directed RNA polymerase subunit RPC12/RpoP
MSIMAEKFYCKWCGSSYSSISSLTSNSCSKSPTKRHQPYEGGEKSKYYCEYCGSSYSSISNLTSNSCSKSPTKYHQPYEGDEKSKYICKHCGSSYSSISNLTSNSCSKSPTKYHQPARFGSNTAASKSREDNYTEQNDSKKYEPKENSTGGQQIHQGSQKLTWDNKLTILVLIIAVPIAIIATIISNAKEGDFSAIWFLLIIAGIFGIWKYIKSKKEK